MPFNVSVAAPLLQCIDGCSTFTGAMGICCGEDGGRLYCYGANCRCTNSTPGGATCSCRPGFQGASCMQQARRRATAATRDDRAPTRPPAPPLARRSSPRRRGWRSS